MTVEPPAEVINDPALAESALWDDFVVHISMVPSMDRRWDRLDLWVLPLVLVILLLTLYPIRLLYPRTTPALPTPTQATNVAVNTWLGVSRSGISAFQLAVSVLQASTAHSSAEFSSSLAVLAQRSELNACVPSPDSQLDSPWSVGVGQQHLPPNSLSALPCLPS